MKKVKNLHGTTGRPIPRNYPTLKRYWESKNGSFDKRKCSRRGCDQPAEVGAHVQIVNPTEDRKWYIVPLRRSCNNRYNTSPFYVKNGDLVELRSTPKKNYDKWW